jgi:hypothetical protein
MRRLFGKERDPCPASVRQPAADMFVPDNRHLGNLGGAVAKRRLRLIEQRRVGAFGEHVDTGEGARKPRRRSRRCRRERCRWRCGRWWRSRQLPLACRRRKSHGHHHQLTAHGRRQGRAAMAVRVCFPRSFGRSRAGGRVQCTGVRADVRAREAHPHRRPASAPIVQLLVILVRRPRQSCGYSSSSSGCGWPSVPLAFPIRNALMNGSSSPSRTPCTSPVVCRERRSFTIWYGCIT